MSEHKEIRMSPEGLNALREYVGGVDPADPQDDEGILDIIREHADLHSGMGMLWSADEAYAEPSVQPDPGYTIEYGVTGSREYILVRHLRADGEIIDEEAYDLVVDATDDL